MKAILKHELSGYFHSLTAYVFGAFLLVFVGIGSMLYNIQQAVANFEYVLGFISLIFVGLVPILTMRVLAEERKQRTDQLLYSLPITTTDIILGKYLALLVVFLIPLVIVAFYPLIFAKFGDVYLLTSYGSLIAFFIMGAALIAIGMFISSLTENLGMAAGICVAVVLFNYYSVSLADYISSSVIGSIIALDALVKNDEIPNFNQVEKISEIKVSESTSLDAKYKENDGLSDNEDDIYFVNKDKEEQPLDTNLVKTYLNNVNALNLGTYVTYNATDEELVKYGLDEPQYNLEVKYTPKSEDSSEDSGDSTDSKAGSSEKTFILHVSAKQDDKAYVRIGDSKIIYEITEDEYKNVTDGSYDSLRHKSVVTADLSDVDSVKVTLEDKDYTIDLSEKKGDVVSTYDGEEIEGTDFTDALKALKASDFTSEEPSEKEEISFTLHYKDDKYPEKEVKIYRYDGTNCLVTIDGKSISLVKRDLVVDLTEAVNAIVLK